MKIGTLFKKTASLIAAGLLSLSCIQPMMLWAEDEPVPSKTPVTENTDIVTPAPSVVPEAAENAAARAADTTAPVIKGIELVENGKTLQNGDTITVNVRATDVDSGVNNIYVQISTKDQYNAIQMFPTVSESYSELYSASYTLADCVPGTYYISQVRVGDIAGNYTDGTINEQNEDGTYSYLYSFEVEDDTVIKVTDIYDGLSDDILEESYFSYENSDDFTVTIDHSIGQYQTIVAEFVSEETNYSVNVALYNGAQGNTFRISYLSIPVYVSEETIATFKLSRIYVTSEGGQRNFIIEQDISDIGFQLKLEPYESVEYSVTATGAEFTRNKEIVHAGDVLEYIIYADGEGVEGSYANVTIEPAVDVWGTEDDFYSIEAQYDASRRGYVGTWTVTDNTYPCEWYISYANFYQNDYGPLIGSYTDSSYPAYVNVEKDGTFTENTMDLHISVNGIDSTGYSTTFLTAEINDAPRRYTLKDLGVSLPEMKSPIEGMNQIAWTDHYGNEITEETELLNAKNNYNDYNSLTIYASYDKVVVTASYNYIGDDGAYCYAQNLELFDPGTTYGEAIRSMSTYKQDYMTAEYTFTGWETDTTYINENEVLAVLYPFHLPFNATYAEGLMVGIYKTYITETGLNSISSVLAPGLTSTVVPKGTTYQEIYDEIVAEPVPAMYPGLRFKGWVYSSQFPLEAVVENGRYMTFMADYENSIVRYIVDERIYGESGFFVEYEDLAYLECKLVEEGDEVVIPETVPGYESVTWVNVMDEPPVTFTAEAGQDYSFYGTPGKSTDTPVDPVDPEETPEPVKPADDLINQAIADVNNAETGDTVVMEMGDANVVPAQVLEAAKGKDVNIVLNMSGYTWTINGKNIYADVPTDINLQVILNTDDIPSNIVKQLAGDNETMQLQLVHTGDFGFKATLTINVGSENAGEYGNLYYYNSEGRMIFNDAGKVSTDGSLSLDFSHASDYVIVFADHDMSVNNAETGVWNSPTPYLATIIICAIGAVLIRKRQLAK